MYRSERLERGKDGRSGFWRVDSADCFADVLDFIEGSKEEWPHGDCQSHQNHGSWGESDDKEYGTVGWAGTKTLKEALSVARRGWEKGRFLMSETLDAANVLQKQSRVLAEGLDVAGSQPFVPAAVAGDPLCMVSHGLDRAKTKPIFRIMVNGAVSHNVSIPTIINRGAAILSWIDKLETVGNQCELLYIDSVRSGQNLFTMGFPIKSAGEPLSIDRSAFMLAHPAMVRRISFALYERHGDLYGPFCSGYGSPDNSIPDSLQTDHSIFFPCMLGSDADWKNPATAILAVERAILKALTAETVDDDIREQMEWAAE